MNMRLVATAAAVAFAAEVAVPALRAAEEPQNNVIALLAAGNIWGATRSRVLSWGLAALGAWVSISPFLWGYAPDAAWTWNAVICGLIVCVTTSYGHRPAALL